MENLTLTNPPRLLRDIPVGGLFRYPTGKTYWRKKKVQGMNDCMAWCESTDAKKTRCPSRLTRTNKVISQDTIVYEQKE